MITLRPHQESAVYALQNNTKGQVIMPTGSGKTMVAINNAQEAFNSCKWDIFLKNPDRKTIIVVAPRILLAQQLCEDFLEYLKTHPMLKHKVLHVHSGETKHFSTTKTDVIKQWYEESYRFNKLIFTTYHSLHRIQEAEISVDTIYFDEAHNSIQKHFHPAVKYFSEEAKKCYYLTATPKHSVTKKKPGMNNKEVYGDVIADIPATKLVEQGYILPPKLIIKHIDVQDEIVNETEHIVDTIDEINANKVLICARSTKQIVKLANSDFVGELASRGYSFMYITSKTGAFINGNRASREEFFEVLNAWGNDPYKKFIVLHHSILSEGINVRGLEAALFLRNMDIVSLCQTIGRVIRKGDETKTHGLVVVPVYDNVGINTAKRVTNVVNTVFTEGKPAISTIKR